MKFQFPIFKYTRGVLAYVIIIGCFSYLFLIAVHAVPVENKELVSQAQGFILAILGVVAGYYFGASKDKSDQDQSKIFPKDPPNP